jgi:MerR family transcriptional regulator, copper efflux regulator
MNMFLNIGEVARQTGLAVSAIRYYEECGLLPPADRQANNRRCYGTETLETIRFISACRNNSMGLSAIRNLQQKLSGTGRQCDEAADILKNAISEISNKIADLQASRRHLSKVATACCADNCGQSDVACNIEDNMKASSFA